MSSIEQMKTEATAAVLYLHRRGWASATSSNYSVRLSTKKDFFVSESGVDKGDFDQHHFMHVDGLGNCIEMPPRKASAETKVHVWLHANLQPGCVLHTHSIFNTLLSAHHVEDKAVRFSDLELLKAIEGIDTHQAVVRLPIFPNTQNMTELVQWLEERREELEVPHAFLIAGHGLYAWGTTVADAKRHIEAYEFLLELKYRAADYEPKST